MIFSVSGHQNVLATHKSTLEFTKDGNLTENGDCILGIKASAMPKAAEGRIRITITAAGMSDWFEATANPDFASDHEMVIRKSDYIDQRTYATNATKAAVDIDRKIVKMLADPDSIMHVEIKQVK